MDALLLCLNLHTWRPVVMATHTIIGILILAPEMAGGLEFFYGDTARKVCGLWVMCVGGIGHHVVTENVRRSSSCGSGLMRSIR